MNYLTSIAKTWNSLNPATLSGAIDVIVIEDEHGSLYCSPFHVRFGKFQLLRPSQKKVNFKVNGQLTDIHMKLGDGGEAFFVFQTEEPLDRIPDDMMTSPVVSAASSTLSSPLSSPKSEPATLEEDLPEYLDLGGPAENLNKLSSGTSLSLDSPSANLPTSLMRKSRTMSSIRSLSPTRAQKLSKQLTLKNIPTKIDSNGELVLDISGYKSSEQDIKSYDKILKDILKDELGDDVDLKDVVKYDEHGNVRIYSTNNESDSSFEQQTLMSPPSISPSSSSGDLTDGELNLNGPLTSISGSTGNYIKTLRLTSDQLKCLNLKYGANDSEFTVDQSKSTITSRIFLWKYNVPVVISDIDGTITKSDALGHVFNMIGKDWTHPGVAKLFEDIASNGYNIMYLTARSVGLADTTRAYLDGIDQEGVKLPVGPVILSPDRTMAALRREVILKKPEVFKITCLQDLRSLYGNINKTPFYAGFGNRITDALSYRSVDIPSSKIFTINPDGDVHMELLELAGYKSSYIHINELVDHFFPPVRGDKKDDGLNVFTDENFTDTVYWREPIPDLSDTDSESESDPDPESEAAIEGAVKDGLEQTQADNKNLNGGQSQNPANSGQDFNDLLNENGDTVTGEDVDLLIGNLKISDISKQMETADENTFAIDYYSHNNDELIDDELDEYNNTVDDLESEFGDDDGEVDNDNYENDSLDEDDEEDYDENNNDDNIHDEGKYEENTDNDIERELNDESIEGGDLAQREFITAKRQY
ncbi:phosphatidate phosphatase [Saccharomycopsis crataegensis]|uniref:Phosphatidate phosphatase n=1 Tax=Saccharomycopsis crataegensis TaxID=43959 RepID=A0AAV5QPD2_9ASCO|nr:phosphatidate phosphatase [Saccharomycopsis crataegensis]